MDLRPRVVPMLGVVAIAVIAWQLSQLVAGLVANGHLADAASYQSAVERWLAGASPYSEQQLAGPHTLGSAVGGAGFVYPPTALPLFLPLALGLEATLGWVLFTHLAFLAVVYVIAWREVPRSPIVAGAIAVAAAISLPGMDEIRFGNASALIAMLLGLVWIAPRQGPLFSVLAGAIKVFPVLGVPWSATGGGAIRPALVVGGALLLISLAIGPSLWIDWMTAMTYAVPSCPDWALTSLPCATGSSIPGFVLAGILFVGALSAPTRAIGFFLLSVAMVTPAPDLYQHYLLVPFVGGVPVACAGAAWAGRQLAGSAAAPVVAPT